MRLAFLDWPVLIRAAGSPTGASYAIVQLAVERHIRAVLSPLVLDEATRTLAQKLPAAKSAFRALLATFPYEISDPSPELTASAAKCVDLTAAGVVTAAQAAKVDCLVTLDSRLIENDKVQECTGLSIVSPREFLLLYEAELPIVA
jgi:predicted nucleic acid-binding protein